MFEEVKDFIKSLPTSMLADFIFKFSIGEYAIDKDDEYILKLNLSEDIFDPSVEYPKLQGLQKLEEWMYRTHALGNAHSGIIYSYPFIRHISVVHKERFIQEIRQEFPDENIIDIVEFIKTPNRIVSNFCTLDTPTKIIKFREFIKRLQQKGLVAIEQPLNIIMLDAQIGDDLRILDSVHKERMFSLHRRNNHDYINKALKYGMPIVVYDDRVSYLPHTTYENRSKYVYFISSDSEESFEIHVHFPKVNVTIQMQGAYTSYDGMIFYLDSIIEVTSPDMRS